MRDKVLRILLVACISVCNYKAQAQIDKPNVVKDSTVKDTAKKTATIEQLSSKLDSISAYIKSDKSSGKEAAGTLCLIDGSPRYTYTSNHKKTGRVIVIDSATFLIKDGYIIEVRLIVGKKVFTNTESPISLTSKAFSITDALYEKNNTDEYIILQEFVSFDGLKGFAPDDGYIKLTKTIPCQTLDRNVGVNSVFDIRIYTDALAAFGKEPNGIFQTSAKFKQFIHRNHFKDKSCTMFQYFKMSLNYSKIDSKQSFVDDAPEVSRLSLMQKNKVSGELAVNLFHCWTEKKSLNDFYIDFGGGFNTVNLARLHDTSSISVQYLFWDIGFNLKTSSNIGFDTYMKPMVQFSPQTSSDNQNKGYMLLTFGGEIFWNPFDSPTSKLFGRINYTVGTKRIEKKNSFSQVQIGYSILLSKLIGSK